MSCDKTSPCVTRGGEFQVTACDARVSQPQTDTLPRPRGPRSGCAASPGSRVHPLSTPWSPDGAHSSCHVPGFPGPLGVGQDEGTFAVSVTCHAPCRMQEPAWPCTPRETWGRGPRQDAPPPHSPAPGGHTVHSRPARFVFSGLTGELLSRSVKFLQET